jgi:hypothetical protein
VVVSFDRVNLYKLMGQVAKRVEDKRLLKLIRAFLNAGVMGNGLVSPSVEGTPQGGPLSPLLSNLVLDELDRELERRGHRFVRYADDSNIYVRSDGAPSVPWTGIHFFFSFVLFYPRVPKKRRLAGAPEVGGQLPQKPLAVRTFIVQSGLERLAAPPHWIGQRLAG